MQERVDLIVKILDEKKAEDIKTFDMSEQDYFVKYVIIAATLGEKHALSLIDELKTKLKAKGEEFLNIESSEEWSVIDLGDILIHLLTPEHRGIYNIEELLESLKKKQGISLKCKKYTKNFKKINKFYDFFEFSNELFCPHCQVRYRLNFNSPMFWADISSFLV